MIRKYKEVILYLFFGGCTTLVSIASYWAAERVIGFDPLVANVISWILAVTFAYVTNRIWVFKSKASGRAAIAKEAVSFFGGRLLTLGLEEVILLIGIRVFHVDSLVVKVLAQIIVIVANYFISKFMVFQKH